MGLYERILDEVSQGEPYSKGEVTSGYGRDWSPPGPGAGGYVTVKDLEREETRREREKAFCEENKQAKEIRILRAFARLGVHSWVQGMAFKALQRKHPAEWDRIRWEVEH